MVPLPSIRGIDVATPSVEVPRLVASIGHSRIPVYRDNINHPVGILWLKDEFQALANGRTPEVTELLHPPLFVPETTKISAVLRQFQRQHEQLGLVVDEYGSVVGLITVEDILEEIVGDIGEPDRPDDARSVTRLPDGVLVVDGLAPIDELRAGGAPVDDSPDYTTAAGFVIATLGAIPVAGNSLTSAGYRWTVLEADGPRVRTLRIGRGGSSVAPALVPANERSGGVP